MRLQPIDVGCRLVRLLQQRLEHFVGAYPPCLNATQLVKHMLHHRLKAVEMGGVGLELDGEVLNRTRHLLLELGRLSFRRQSKERCRGNKNSAPNRLAVNTKLLRTSTPG